MRNQAMLRKLKKRECVDVSKCPRTASEVAKEYAGIVIAPYQGSLRLDVMWYYTWDCASGCIWDTSIIAGVEPSLDRGAEHE